VHNFVNLLVFQARLQVDILYTSRNLYCICIRAVASIFFFHIRKMDYHGILATHTLGMQWWCK